MEAASIPAATPLVRPRLQGDHLNVRADRRPACPAGRTSAIHDLRDDGDLSRLGTNIVAGLSNGAIWALIAIGYTLVYGIIELINFAHGDVFMIGSFISASFFGHARAAPRARAPASCSSGCC